MVGLVPQKLCMNAYHCMHCINAFCIVAVHTNTVHIYAVPTKKCTEKSAHKQVHKRMQCIKWLNWHQRRKLRSKNASITPTLQTHFLPRRMIAQMYLPKLRNVFLHRFQIYWFKLKNALQECINHTKPSNSFPSQDNDCTYSGTQMYLPKLKNVFLQRFQMYLSKFKSALEECINHIDSIRAFKLISFPG